MPALMRAAQILLIVSACLPCTGSGANSGPPSASNPGLILQLDEGERRVRRPKAEGLAGLPDPFIIKVDRKNGGSRDLVMGYEELAPGQAIRRHRHLTADEIIFVYSGSGEVSLGTRQARVESGATVYIPANTPISLRNSGSAPLAIAFVFSKPGFEEILRENSVPEGQPATMLTAAERRRNEARHRGHTVYEDRAH